MTINSPLHLLFGRSTSVFSILSVLAAATLALFGVWHLAGEEEKTLSERIVLSLLAADIGGGVVANLTRGTQLFYSEGGKRVGLFLIVHLIQPTVLCLLYPTSALPIALLGVYAVLASASVRKSPPGLTQKLWALGFFALGITATSRTGNLPPEVGFLLGAFLAKLILAFGVSWYPGKINRL